MNETGIVIAVKDSRAEVRISASQACGSCGACGGDGTVLEGVRNDAQARIGDRVTVEISEQGRLRGALIGFGLPLLGLLVGYVIGALVAARFLEPRAADGVGAAVALLSAASVFVHLRKVGDSMAGGDRYEPVVHAIIHRGLEGDSPAGESGYGQDGREVYHT